MKCNKCDSCSTVILRKKDHYCGNCFLICTNHKFRACIGKNKILSKNDKVLLCLSGGPGSSALLDLVHHGISLDIHKKLRIIPLILHINDTNDCTTVEAIKNKSKSYNIKAYFCHISDFLQKELTLPTENTLEQYEMNEEFQATLKSMPPTVHVDFLNKAKRSLYIRYAKLLDCKYVFTAETTSTLAINLLSNIAIGRGSQVENDIGFMDCRDETVKILRPMKDISTEELDYYIKIKNLPYVATQDINKNTSLQATISSFVTELQENFQSTISAICRTADKIGVADIEQCNRCAICKSPLNKGVNSRLTALDATIFSRTISHGGHHTTEDHKSSETLFPYIDKYLCYSCSRNYSEMNKNASHLQDVIEIPIHCMK